MFDNNYYTPEIHGDYCVHSIGDLALEEGETIRDCKLAYKTFGRLNESRSNAILVTTWYAGTSEIMEDVYIGEGHALDPTKYFIIVINQIGNGLSSSPHNTPAPHNGPRFPKVRIADDVRAQHKLLTEVFNIQSLELVVGASMGALQTYEWAVRFPSMVKRAAPIAGVAKTTHHEQLFSEALIGAMTSDPAWDDGWYSQPHAVHRGLRRHARLWGTMGFSTEALKQEKWTDLGFNSFDDFLVGFLENYFLPMDPNDLISMAWKWRNADVGRIAGGDLRVALRKIKACVFVMPIDEDLFYPPRDCLYEANVIPNAFFRPIRNVWGHLGIFGLEPGFIEQIDKNLNELLAIQLAPKKKLCGLIK